KQKVGGYWVNNENFYVYTKYKGTVWTFIVLAELNADGNDDRIKNACEYILKYSQDRESGGFSIHGNVDDGGVHEQVIPCLTGNMIWALVRFGYFKDPRVQQGIEWILQYQRLDDGIDKAPKGWPYERFKNCWGKHTCHMGVVKNLKALAEIPPDKRSDQINDFINRAAEYMLNHHIYKRSHDLNVIAKEEWTQFGFPLMWKIDALEVLDILTKLGYKDDRMQDAIDLVIAKQNENGRWLLEKTFNGRMQANVEQKSKESKWITLKAIKVLKEFHN
ncbi:MAG: nitrogen fixation protein NifH, partial [Promethearchaeota archaeon]